jgi:two-component system sensor histidine kinase ComP
MAEEIIETQRRTQSLSIINKLLFKNLENERIAVAREIHDGPLQLGLEVSRRLKQLLQEPSGDEDIAVKISAIQEITQELNYQLRSVCADLRPSSLADLGLIPAVESWCQQVMQKEPIIISLKVRDISRDQRFKEDIELGAFRFLQEGLTNDTPDRPKPS